MVGKRARFLAPIALAAVTLGVYLIVESTVNQPETKTRHRTVVVNGRRRPVHPAHRGPKYYVVRTGDTLSAIAARTGVSMSQLAHLNPALAASPNSLQTGQRLRLRR